MLQARSKLEIEKEVLEGSQIPLISLSGNLDIYTAQEFRKLLEGYLGDSDLKNVIVDVEQLEYIDSSGIGVMFSAAVRLKKRSGAFWLLKPQDMVQMALQITRAAAQMNICDSFDEAITKINQPESASS